ncbi:putative ferroportin-1 [Helianthus annuus]|nr:putative ferroportin-1 [Helianthus annuus]
MHNEREMEEVYPVKMEDEHLLPHHQDDIPTSVLLNLYLGHFLARWGARTWEFSVGLYMINIWPDSLLMAAAYGVVESASTTLFGPLVGQWIDNSTYPKGWWLKLFWGPKQILKLEPFLIKRKCSSLLIL